MTAAMLMLVCFAQADDEARKNLGALQHRLLGLLDGAPMSVEIRVETRFQPPGDSIGLRTAVATSHKEYLIVSSNSYFFESEIAPGHLQREHFRSGVLTIDSPTARIYSRESYMKHQPWPEFCGQDCLHFAKESLLAPVFFPPIQASIRSLPSRNAREIGVAYESRTLRSQPLLVEVWIDTETELPVLLNSRSGRKSMNYRFRYKETDEMMIRKLDSITVSDKAKLLEGKRSLIRSQEQSALHRSPP